jgi:hypothetical protein
LSNRRNHVVSYQSQRAHLKIAERELDRRIRGPELYGETQVLSALILALCLGDTSIFDGENDALVRDIHEVQQQRAQIVFGCRALSACAAPRSNTNLAVLAASEPRVPGGSYYYPAHPLCHAGDGSRIRVLARPEINWVIHRAAWNRERFVRDC